MIADRVTRRSPLTLLVFFLTTGFWFAGPQHTDAQGLLRRLRDRIESRVRPDLPPPEIQPGADLQRRPPLDERLQRLLDRLPQDLAAPEQAGRYDSPPDQRIGQPPWARERSFSDSSPRPDSRSNLQPISPRDPSDGAASRRQGYGASILDRPGSVPRRDQQSGTPRFLHGRPSLGIQVEPSRGPVRGLTVVAIEPHSLADEAGVQLGDTIVSFGGQPTPDARAIESQLRRMRIGDRVNVGVVRGRRTNVLQVPLVTPPSLAQTAAKMPIEGSNPQSVERTQRDFPADNTRGDANATAENNVQPLPFPRRADAANESAGTSGEGRPSAARPTRDGATAAVSDDSPSPTPIELGITTRGSSRSRGLIVESVKPESTAAKAGLQVGDRLVSIKGRMLISSQSLQRELMRGANEDELPVKLVRDGRLLEVDLLASSKTPEPNASAESQRSSSMLGNVGSVLGGFFGSGNAEKGKQESSDTSNSDRAGETLPTPKVPKEESETETESEVLPPPAAQPTQQRSGKTPIPGDSQTETLEFGDAEPIEQALFGKDAPVVLPTPRRNDPPSLRNSTLPERSSQKKPQKKPGAEDAQADDREQTIEQLRMELRELQQRLKTLEAERDGDESKAEEK